MRRGVPQAVCLLGGRALFVKPYLHSVRHTERILRFFKLAAGALTAHSLGDL